ncbi:UDP-galactose transporter [Naganishia albida]|nr:UDP-galactose transporter [Naganishia albida]
MSLARLLTCVLGVYATFLLWAIAQERLSAPFPAKTHPHTPARLPSTLFINACQSLSSCLGALIYLLIKRRSDGAGGGAGLWSLVGWDQVFPQRTIKSAAQKNGNAHVAQAAPQKSLLSLLLQVSAFQTCASPIGFASLKYISYPMMVLAKSCKLIPVLLLNVILYRRKFKPYKYVVVALVSAGIALFMYNGSEGGAGKRQDRGSLVGMSLLGVNLIIDGLTNSTQDQLFTLHPRFKGQQLMFNMSLLSLCMTLPFLVLPPHTVALLSTILPSPLHALVADPVSHHATESLAAPLFQSLQFLHEHPTALLPLFAYALLGGLGQLFIFETISHFGSLTLVMVTVTRKLVTMLLSVVVFGHRLRAGQWVGVAVVFLGIGVEAGMKRREIINKRIMEERQKSKLKAL